MKAKNKSVIGNIFNIQRYSIHDGPGIRTTIFLKGCPLRCFWCQNPESQKREHEIFFKRELCTLCGKCVEVCPVKATTLSLSGYMHLDRELCTGCGKCTEVCPNEARKLTGKLVPLEDLMGIILKDIKYYQKSGGGVTLSGGDPVSQASFASKLLRSCRDAGIHTAIDTSGFASWDILKKLLYHTDLVLLDIKCIDEKQHVLGTEVSNSIILENAKKIYKMKKKMLVRVPLIPGYNDSADTLGSIVGFVVRELPGIEVEILPYNKLGESKYNYLSRDGFEGQRQTEEHVASLQAVVERTKRKVALRWI